MPNPSPPSILLMSMTWLIRRLMRPLEFWMRRPIESAWPPCCSTVAAMLMAFSGSRRSCPSIAISWARARSVSPCRAMLARCISSCIWLAMMSCVGSHASALPRTVSRHSSNEPRGVRRGPSGPYLMVFSGLPAQRTADTCSGRSASSQPSVAGSKHSASMPGHCATWPRTASGQSSTDTRSTMSSASVGRDCTMACAVAASMSPCTRWRPDWVTISAGASSVLQMAAAWAASARSVSSPCSSVSIRRVRVSAERSMNSARSRASSVCTVDASTCAMTSVAMRIEYGTWRALM